ncbi:LOW QUALITY PROTEIN: hypothetical protein QTO34_017047 [Cnephaeus nilssonii]|uniref:Uncharacterized protein n=1 Tax=Cnephaeus nilssonii TaxID=3371016 RepID=A0AA40I0A7_CNENI|nr:LOW QUALITY PROTEIN: hypothetical protein QTO34_017047 [Eptesicus nilssonii]
MRPPQRRVSSEMATRVSADTLYPSSQVFTTILPVSMDYAYTRSCKTTIKSFAFTVLHVFRIHYLRLDSATFSLLPSPMASAKGTVVLDQPSQLPWLLALGLCSHCGFVWKDALSLETEKQGTGGSHGASMSGKAEKLDTKEKKPKAAKANAGGKVKKDNLKAKMPKMGKPQGSHNCPKELFDIPDQLCIPESPCTRGSIQKLNLELKRKRRKFLLLSQHQFVVGDKNGGTRVAKLCKMPRYYPTADNTPEICHHYLYQVDISGVKIPKHHTDDYFKKKLHKPRHQRLRCSTQKEKYKITEQPTAVQKDMDLQILPKIKAVPQLQGNPYCTCRGLVPYHSQLERLVLLQQCSPAMNPASGALLIEVTCRCGCVRKEAGHVSCVK